MSYDKRKNLSKNSTKTAITKVPGPFVFTKNLAQSLLENQIFEASYLCLIYISKTSKPVQIITQTSSEFFLHRTI